MTSSPLRLSLVCILLLCCAAVWADFTDAASKVRDAVITVAVENRTGSGFMVNSEGNALTNKHVVGDAKSVTVTLRNGDKLAAAVVKCAADRDLCLLKLERQHLPAVQFGSSTKLKQGQGVAALGAPLGLSGSLTKGSVSATDREIEGQKFIQLDAALNQGNSGGPVINEDGLVVGVATKAAKEAQNMGFAIPSADAMAFLSDNGVAFQAALGEAPKGAEKAEAPAEAPATPGEEAAPPEAAPVPAAPPSPLTRPWTLLVAAAVIAFVVALITALLVTGKKAAPVVAPQPVQYTYAQSQQAPPMVAQPGAVRPAAPPAAPPQQEDLSDIDIDLR